MKKTNLSWVGALLVFALLLWCTAATPGKIADPSTYTCAVYSSALSLLPPVVAIVLALNTKEVYTSLLVGIATGALLYANGNLELALTTLFFNEDGGMISKLSDASNVGILVFLVMLGILVALMNKAGGSAAFGRWASTHIHTRAAGRKILRRQPAQRLRCGAAVPAAHHHLPRGRLPRLRHRHFVGYLLHPRAHRLPCVPGG